MDEVEKKAICHYNYELKYKTLVSKAVLISLQKDEVFDDKEKTDLQKCRSTFKKMSRIIEAVKRRQWGFSAFCRALLEEKLSNKFIVDKMEAKVKTIKEEQTKQVNKPKKDTKQSLQINQYYKELHEIAHGNKRKPQVDPSQGEIDDLVDYFWSCRDELTDKQPNDKSLLSLIYELKTDSKRLQYANRKHKDKNASLSESLSSTERLLNRTERELEELRQLMKDKIKTEVEQEVKRRLMSFEVKVPDTTLTDTDDECIADDSDTVESLCGADDPGNESEENQENQSNVNFGIHVNAANNVFVFWDKSIA